MFSFNSRGMRKKARRREIRSLAIKCNADIVCIQETKMENMKDRIYKSIWRYRVCDWAFKGAEGRSGGILTIWNENVFCKTSAWHTREVLVVNGFLKSDGTLCCILDVYAPCQMSEKKLLWEVISGVIEQSVGYCVCVIGDFNSIRNRSARIGRSSGGDTREITTFENFIQSNKLVEIPLIGNAFTWYRPDGTSKSKLDRMLMNDEWLGKWPNQRQKGLGRSFSDHRPFFYRKH